MAISFPDMERATYEAAASRPTLVDARMALHSAVRHELEHGASRRHVEDVLSSLACEFAERGEGLQEAAVLDVLDALDGNVMPSMRL